MIVPRQTMPPIICLKCRHRPISLRTERRPGASLWLARPGPLLQPILSRLLPTPARPIQRALSVRVFLRKIHPLLIQPAQHGHLPFGRSEHGGGLAPAGGGGFGQRLPLLFEPIQARHAAALRGHVHAPQSQRLRACRLAPAFTRRCATARWPP